MNSICMCALCSIISCAVSLLTSIPLEKLPFGFYWRSYLQKLVMFAVDFTSQDTWHLPQNKISFSDYWAVSHFLLSGIVLRSMYLWACERKHNRLIRAVKWSAFLMKNGSSERSSNFSQSVSLTASMLFTTCHIASLTSIRNGIKISCLVLLKPKYKILVQSSSSQKSNWSW